MQNIVYMNNRCYLRHKYTSHSLCDIYIKIIVLKQLYVRGQFLVNVMEDKKNSSSETTSKCCITHSFLEIITFNSEEGTYTVVPAAERSNDCLVGCVVHGCSLENIGQMKDIFARTHRINKDNLFYILESKTLCANALTLLRYNVQSPSKPIFHGICLIPVYLTKDPTDIEWPNRSVFYRKKFYVRTPYYDKKTKTLTPSIFSQITFF